MVAALVLLGWWFFKENMGSLMLMIRLHLLLETVKNGSVYVESFLAGVARPSKTDKTPFMEAELGH